MDNREKIGNFINKITGYIAPNVDMEELNDLYFWCENYFSIPIEPPVKPVDCELYWKHRCEAVEDFVRKSPCDPDIYEDQIKAYAYWKKLCDIKPEDYLSKLSV